MFNTTIQNTETTLKVNAISGTLVKNYTKSFFLRFAGGSPLANRLFDQNPCLECDQYGRREKHAVVIQAMILADGYFLCEVMHKEDFEEATRYTELVGNTMQHEQS